MTDLLCGIKLPFFFLLYEGRVLVFRFWSILRYIGLLLILILLLLQEFPIYLSLSKILFRLSTSPYDLDSMADEVSHFQIQLIMSHDSFYFLAVSIRHTWRNFLSLLSFSKCWKILGAHHWSILPLTFQNDGTWNSVVEKIRWFLKRFSNHSVWNVLCKGKNI